MSDRVAVMRSGKIVQIGQPHEIYEEPVDTYVADFLGVSNLMQVEVVERGPRSRCRVKLGESTLEVERCTVDELGAAHCVIRPERVRIGPVRSAGAHRVPALVERRSYVGHMAGGMPPPTGGPQAGLGWPAPSNGGDSGQRFLAVATFAVSHPAVGEVPAHCYDEGDDQHYRARGVELRAAVAGAL